MTNEEAIKGLKNVSTMFTGYKPNEEMFAMAIEALEQQPCDDCISRENLLKAFKDECRGECDNCPYFRKVDKEYKCRLIADFPSAIPKHQPCEDCISRQEAINCVTLNEFRYKIVEDMKTLPSVTPKEKTGKWIYTGDYITDGMLKCSSCGYEHDVADRFLYCPNCGARMVEPQESEVGNER